MKVTRWFADTLEFDLDGVRRRSIEIAVAQHLRSRRGVHAARKALRDLGVSEDEILRRRRAESTDDVLTRLLRLAVTIVITQGRLSDTERRLVSRSFPEHTWNAIVEATTDAYAAVVWAEAQPDCTTESDIDMDVGDY